jgi:hypothetical protein
VLTTPGRAAKEVLASMAPEPAKVCAPGPGPLEAKAREVASVTTTAPGASAASKRPARPLSPEEEARRAVARERRERERQRYGPVRWARQEGREIPGQYEALVGLVEAALGNKDRRAGASLNGQAAGLENQACATARFSKLAADPENRV